MYWTDINEVLIIVKMSDTVQIESHGDILGVIWSCGHTWMWKDLNLLRSFDWLRQAIEEKNRVEVTDG